MPFKYSCFISYRHGQSKLAERIIDDLSTALWNELELLTNKKIYVDKLRLKGGDFYNDELARALCESACMIMVFTPTYFDRGNPYCAREFKAMEALEALRLSALEDLGGKKIGFIIPIIFRGEDFLPSEIRDKRQYYNFGEFLLSDVEISKHPRYAKTIQEIAKTVFEIDQVVDALPQDPCKGCDTFSLPPPEEVLSWLSKLKPVSLAFPGRTQQHGK